jgi:hypothetical protein
MRKVRRVDPLTYFIIKVFGRRLENFVSGLLFFLTGVGIFIVYAIFFSHATPASGAHQNDAIWMFLIGYGLPLILVIIGITQVVSNFPSLFVKVRMAHPVASVVRIIFGLLFLGLGALTLLAEMLSIAFQNMPITESITFYIYSGIALLGGCLMVLAGILDLTFGR